MEREDSQTDQLGDVSSTLATQVAPSQWCSRVAA